MVAIAYGGALVVSGWLLARGVSIADRARWLESLGGESAQRRPAERPAEGVRRRLGGEWQLLRVGAAVLGGAAGFYLMGPVGFLAGSVAGPVVVRAREARAASLRRDLLDRQLGEAVVTVAAAVRAGLSVRRAVTEAAEGSDSPMKAELEAVVHRLETGEPLDEALSRLDRALGLSDAGLLVNALTVHRRTGGHLPSLLDEIAQLIHVRLEDRRAVRALTAQARSSGVVLAVLPVAFVALLSGTGGDGLGAFYRTSSGTVLLLLAMTCLTLGFAWMRRIVQRAEAT